MNVNEIVIYIMLFFMVIGAIDKIMGNKFGYGEKFDQGFLTMGPLALAMLGIISLAPIIATYLKPILVPIYSFLGADPSMFATTFLAIDMGGYTLANELALTADASLFSGILLGVMMGPTIVFTIPVALGIIEKVDYPYLAKGILAGIITIPLGCLIGGLVAGFSLSMVLHNLVPIIIVAVLICLGLWKIPHKLIKGFTLFGQAILIITTIGIALGIIKELTGICIISGLIPISEGIKTVGSIAIMLAGAFPFVHFITKVFNKYLITFGKLLGMNKVAAAGMIASLAHSIPMFKMLKDMDNRGKVLNTAFSVSGAFLLGSHLGFTAGISKEMIIPMLLGKLTAGISAIIVANLLISRKNI